jgi:mRNA-degrading endonuclease toxin of MazEF toxin-antitoxin module
MVGPFYRRGSLWRVATEWSGDQLVLIFSSNGYNEREAIPTVEVLYVTYERLVETFDVEVRPMESDIDRVIYVQCDALGTVDKDYLAERLGQVPGDKMRKIEQKVAAVLGLPPIRYLPFLRI